MGIWCSSNHLRTPTWASPSAPPPSRATPILGREAGAGLASAAVAGCCGGVGGSCAKQGHARQRTKSAENGRRTVDPLLLVGWAKELCSLSMLPVFQSVASNLAEPIRCDRL